MTLREIPISHYESGAEVFKNRKNIASKIH